MSVTETELTCVTDGTITKNHTAAAIAASAAAPMKTGRIHFGADAFFFRRCPRGGRLIFSSSTSASSLEELLSASSSDASCEFSSRSRAFWPASPRWTSSMMALSMAVSGEKLSLKSSAICSVSANWTGSTSSSAEGSICSGSPSMGGTISASDASLRLPYSSSASCSSCGV